MSLHAMYIQKCPCTFPQHGRLYDKPCERTSHNKTIFKAQSQPFSVTGGEKKSIRETKMKFVCLHELLSYASDVCVSK